MTIRIDRWLIGLAGALLAAVLAFFFYYHLSDAKNTADGAQDGKEEPTAEMGRRRTVRGGTQTKPENEAEAETGDSTKEGGGEPAEEPMSEEGGETPEEPKTEEEMQADREEALVEAFDGMTDKWQDPSESDVPMAEVEKFRQQFNKIPKARQEECLQRALNLLPDENIMLLAGILLDKEQPKEYLDLVFNDILNRDESVKRPLLKEIYKDKEHPCWETTAWILDATGESPGK